MHPAKTIFFNELKSGLDEKVLSGEIVVRHEDGLSVYTYSRDSVYSNNWNFFTKIARGLILDHEKIVALPFPKFFNHFENHNVDLNDKFRAYEKMDGSLGIAFYYNGTWKMSTKGSISSEQAKKGTEMLQNHDLTPGNTYLFEIIYPENRVVINYGWSGLVLIGAYDKDGNEFNREELEKVSKETDLKISKEHKFDNFNSILEEALLIDSSQEGWVLVYENGERVKVKGKAYCEVHKMIDGVTPLNIWDKMHGDPLLFKKESVPEEFWVEFDEILDVLQKQYNNFAENVENAYSKVKDLSNKELGLIVKTLEFGSFMFAWRKALNKGDSSELKKLFLEQIKPKGNSLVLLKNPKSQYSEEDNLSGQNVGNVL